MILAFDTSTAACTAALFDADGGCIARADEVIGRGHAERLVPMIDELLAGRRPAQVLVGLGPGSFTGLRVAIAAAHGMAIGWDVPIHGFSSLALVAAGCGPTGQVAAAVTGGHGELFIQQFRDLRPVSPVVNLAPPAAARTVDCDVVAGSGADVLVEARGWGEARDLLPSAADTLRLPPELRTLPPKPVYARAPDARALAPA